MAGRGSVPRVSVLATLVAACALFALSALASATQASARAHHAAARPSHRCSAPRRCHARRRSTAPAARLYWGALIGSQFTGSQPPWDWSALDAFLAQDAAGKGMSVLHFGGQFYSQTTCGGYCAFPSALLQGVRSHGMIPFYSWGSTSANGVQGFTDAQIAAGAQDAYITQWAQDAKTWGQPMFLRFDWEMNGSWFGFGVGAEGNTAADYVAMWRHVHDIFTTVGASNVTWVWCPDINSGRFPPYTSLYPGDAYVDWTCLDGYNGDNPWTSFHNLFAPSYALITALAPRKPIFIAETGSTESGGSKAKWITDMLADLPRSFPKVRGVLWGDRADGGTGGKSDWDIETSHTAQSAFAAGIASPVYLANTFASLAGNGPILPPAVGGPARVARVPARTSACRSAGRRAGRQRRRRCR
jgi:Glycosyl hydrolase family 26